MAVGLRRAGPVLCLLLGQCGSRSEAPIARPAGDFGLIEEWAEANQADLTLDWVRAAEFDWSSWRRDIKNSRCVFTTDGELVYLGLSGHVSERIVFSVFPHMKRLDMSLCSSLYVEVKGQPELESLTVSVVNDLRWSDRDLSVTVSDLPKLRTVTIGVATKKATPLVMERLPVLKTLDLRGFAGPRLDVRAHLALEALDFTSCQTEDVICAGLPRLERVRVHWDCRIGKLDLRGVTRLKTLEIGCHRDCGVATLVLEPTNAILPGVCRVEFTGVPQDRVVARLFDGSGGLVREIGKTDTEDFLFAVR